MGVDFNVTGIPDSDKFEIVKHGIATIPSYSISAVGNTTEEVIVTHNLGYNPAVLAYYIVGSDTSPWSGSVVEDFSASGSGVTITLMHLFFTYITSSIVVFQVESISGRGAGSTGSSYDIEYYLMRARASS